MNSSTTTTSPASPKTSSSMISRAASSASATVSQTRDPFPPASPEAFTTIGAPRSRIQLNAGSSSRNVWYSAVGTPTSSMRSLAKALLASIRAAPEVGPNAGIPRDWNLSTHPAARGPSGPTTARSIASSSAHDARAPTSPGSRSTVRESLAMPPLGRVA